MDSLYPISLPDLKTLKSGLDAMQNDISSAVQEEPELAEQSKFLLELIGILQEEVAAIKDPKKVERKKEIAIIAQLHLLYDLLDEMFMDEEFDEDEYEMIDEDELTEEEK
jgi:hypothetical protein